MGAQQGRVGSSGRPDALGCQAVFDLDHYLQVRFGADPDGPELAFMASESPTLGQQEPFAGAGLTFSLPVASADARHAELLKREVPIASAPSDKPWGWRSFVAVDPNGVRPGALGRADRG